MYIHYIVMFIKHFISFSNNIYIFLLFIVKELMTKELMIIQFVVKLLCFYELVIFATRFII
jgi:hypothetical protein